MVMSRTVTVPDGVMEIRQTLCEAAGCQASCDYADPCAACPNGHFPTYIRCNEPIDHKGQNGLGDIVESIAKPIARFFSMKCLDEAGNLRPESNCAKRRDRLNRIGRK